MMLKKYFGILFLLCLPVLANAGTMILEDYPVMYFPTKEGVKLSVVEDIVLDAIDRSSYPKHLWSIDSEKPGEVIARLNVRRHVLRMKISYDTHKINVQYYDSTRLSFSENDAGLRRIHSKYADWSGFLLQKIKFVAKRKTKMSFVNESPIKKVVVTSSGGTAKSKTIVVSAYSEVGDVEREAGIYDTATNSALFSKEMVKQIKKKKPGNISVRKISWNRNLKEFNTSHRSRSLAAVCKQENADTLVLGYLEEWEGGSGGIRPRNMTYYSYGCADDDLVKETSEIIDQYDEAFPYQIALVKSLKQFVHRYNILK